MADCFREVARALLDIEAVVIGCKASYTYSSGIASPMYTDLRLLMSFPEERQLVLDYLLQRIGDVRAFHTIDVVAGVATAGIPYAAWVAAGMSKPLVYVRESAKRHGKQQQVEGRVVRGQNVIIIEDLISTGASALNCAAALRDVGAEVDDCFAVFSYELPIAVEAFTRARVNAWTLITVSTLLDVARSSGYIQMSQYETVTKWLDDYQKPETT